MTRTICNRLARDTRGATLVEFALVAPVLLTLLMGGMELGHTMYVRAVLRGQVEAAARSMSLEGSSSTTKIDAIETSVRTGVRQVMKDADVTFTKTTFHDYRNAQARVEEYKDSRNLPFWNYDGTCNHGEAYVDANNSGSWDLDSGVDGRGGAKDVLLLNVQVKYPRMPLGRFFSSDPDVTLQASTLLRNQPSDDQAAAPVRSCPS